METNAALYGLKVLTPELAFYIPPPEPPTLAEKLCDAAKLAGLCLVAAAFITTAFIFALKSPGVFAVSFAMSLMMGFVARR